MKRSKGHWKRRARMQGKETLINSKESEKLQKGGRKKRDRKRGRRIKKISQRCSKLKKVKCIPNVKQCYLRWSQSYK